MRHNTIFKTKRFTECTAVDSKIKGLKRSEYMKSGNFPVVDQGQEYVSGFSDKSELLYTNTPFILFGDHTRVFKYIDSPVVLGNDGIKVIHSKGNMHLHYLYFYLSSIKIPNTGYNRHFKYLKNQKFSVHKKEDQLKIATILSTIDQEIEQTEQIIQKTEELKKGFIQQIFNNRSIWPRVKLSSVCRKITDGTHRTPKYTMEGIPFLRINDIQEETINWRTVKYISPEEHAQLIKRCHPEKGDVLLSKNGTIGITKIVDWDREFSIFVSLCLLKPKVKRITSEYLNLVLGSEYLITQAKKRSKQGTVTNLHLEEIRDFSIPLPSFQEQNGIVEKINAITIKEMKENNTKRNLLKLKHGLLQDIFERRVSV